MSFSEVINLVSSMPNNTEVSRLLSPFNLCCQNIHWSDSDRKKKSCWGSNITDQTLVVERDGVQHRMPAIRRPNFSDETADVRLENISIPTGNHKGGELRMTPLRTMLENLSAYTSSGERVANMYHERDSHILTSAQVGFLPLPESGAVEFTINCYAYQSTRVNPAQIVLLVSQLGTSIQVLNEKRNQIWHNNGGVKAPLLGERKSAVEKRTGSQIGNSEGERMSTVALIQIPLKIPQERFDDGPLTFCSTDGGFYEGTKSFSYGSATRRITKGGGSGYLSYRPDMEHAIVTAGKGRGKHPELAGMGYKLERDPSCPIRITFMMYQATANGVMDERLAREFNRRIETIYNAGEFRGSLVIPRATGSNRPTARQPTPTPVSDPVFSDGKPASGGVTVPGAPFILND